MVQLKIQLSENEAYELTIPSVISSRELSVIITKLQQINRISSKVDFDIGEEGEKNNSGNQRVKGDERLKRKELFTKIKQNRDILVDILSTFYNSKGEEKLKEVFTKYDMDILFKGRNQMSGGHWIGLRKQMKIKPQELNLKRFAKRGEIINDGMRIKPLNL